MISNKDAFDIFRIAFTKKLAEYGIRCKTFSYFPEVPGGFWISGAEIFDVEKLIKLLDTTEYVYNMFRKSFQEKKLFLKSVDEKWKISNTTYLIKKNIIACKENYISSYMLNSMTEELHKVFNGIHSVIVKEGFAQ